MSLSMVDTSLSASNIKDYLKVPEDDPTIVFLSSSLNNMLVCGILKGIHLSLTNFKYDTNKGQDPNETQVFRFNTIEILDPRIM